MELDLYHMEHHQTLFMELRKAYDITPEYDILLFFRRYYISQPSFLG
jgi:hypothetical protein